MATAMTDITSIELNLATPIFFLTENIKNTPLEGLGEGG